MRIMIIGAKERTEEMIKSLVPHNDITVAESAGSVAGFDTVIDFNTDESRYSIPYSLSNQLLIAGAVEKTLEEISGSIKGYKNIAGMNLWPSMIDRPIKEVSFLQNSAATDFINFAKHNNWAYKVVKDEIGMVTPRILALIINEAANTLQAGTATKEDIDKGMELGTNYPLGPLKWCDRVGIQRIINLIEKLYIETGEERYKMCNLLVEMNKNKQNFY